MITRFSIKYETRDKKSLQESLWKETPCLKSGTPMENLLTQFLIEQFLLEKAE